MPQLQERIRHLEALERAIDDSLPMLHRELVEEDSREDRYRLDQATAFLDEFQSWLEARTRRLATQAKRLETRAEKKRQRRKEGAA